MDGSSHSCRDGDKWVCLPSLIVYSVDQWVVFVVFVGEGLVWESILTICEFYKLECKLRGGCNRCLCLVWGSYNA